MNVGMYIEIILGKIGDLLLEFMDMYSLNT